MYLLIVTGMSGAGKTSVLKRLEDIGFFCVDNLPCEMLPGFLQLCEKATTPVEQAAVVMDSRESVLGSGFQSALDALEAQNVHYDIIFLDCSDEVLSRRYSETRRRHPLNPQNIQDGIRREREMLAAYRHRAKFVVDTTHLTPVELQHMLEESLSLKNKDKFLLLIESFGYKHGVPIEADYVFDMRFTANPFYEDELRALSGIDAPVRDFVMQDPDFLYLLDTVETMIRRLAPRFMEQGKHRLMIAFGCTGGRHRSVCAAQNIYERVKNTYSTVIIHRDTILERNDIQNR